MAGTDGHPDADLAPPVPSEDAAALRAGFFETVRLLARASGTANGPVGGDRAPEAEPLRFAVSEGFRHPDGEIAELSRGEEGDPVRVTVGFMGLTGPMGVLPDHYGETVLTRARGRDVALEQFLDLFNHRAISLFYRAWAKYRLPVRFEETGGDGSDPFSAVLAALAGITPPAADPSMLAAAAPLARRVRSPSALQRALALLFDLPVTVEELRPRHIRIDPAEQTRIGEDGVYATLGETAVLGATAMDVAGRFRLRIGPLDRARFLDFFQPGGVRERLAAAVRHAVGPAADFDLQLVLRREDVAPLQLDQPTLPVRLGQNSWLSSGPAERDRDDAVLAGRDRAASSLAG